MLSLSPSRVHPVSPSHSVAMCLPIGLKMNFNETKTLLILADALGLYLSVLLRDKCSSLILAHTLAQLASARKMRRKVSMRVSNSGKKEK
jgi:hypothetical protein